MTSVVYYKKDIRIPLACLAVFQLLLLLALASSLVLFLYSWQVGLTSLITALFLIIYVGKLQAWLETILIRFPNHEFEDVLYGEIENIESARRIKIAAEDIGGIYVKNDVVFIGSLKGERKCQKSEFNVEPSLSGSFGNYLTVKMGQKQFAFFPKWTGPIKDHPATQADKVKWAHGHLQKLLGAEVNKRDA